MTNESQTNEMTDRTDYKDHQPTNQWSRHSNQIPYMVSEKWYVRRERKTTSFMKRLHNWSLLTINNQYFPSSLFQKSALWSIFRWNIGRMIATEAQHTSRWTKMREYLFGGYTDRWRWADTTDTSLVNRQIRQKWWARREEERIETEGPTVT